MNGDLLSHHRLYWYLSGVRPLQVNACPGGMEETVRQLHIPPFPCSVPLFRAGMLPLYSSRFARRTTSLLHLLDAVSDCHREAR